MAMTHHSFSYIPKIWRRPVFARSKGCRAGDARSRRCRPTWPRTRLSWSRPGSRRPTRRRSLARPTQACQRLLFWREPGRHLLTHALARRPLFAVTRASPSPCTPSSHQHARTPAHLDVVGCGTPGVVRPAKFSQQTYQRAPRLFPPARTGSGEGPEDTQGAAAAACPVRHVAKEGQGRGTLPSPPTQPLCHSIPRCCFLVIVTDRLSINQRLSCTVS